MPTPSFASKSVWLALAVAASTAFAGLVSQDDVASEAPALPRFIEHFVEHGGRPAHLQFDPSRRRLNVVGEARRPFVLDSTTDPRRPVWWTTIGRLEDAPELRYLLLEEGRRRLDEGERAATGLPELYTTDEGFAALHVRFGERANAYVNTNAGSLDVDDPTHFRRLTTIEGLEAFLLVGQSGNLDLVVPHDSVEGRLFSGEAEGDGSPERLGGLQIDLVLQAELELVPASALDWLGVIDIESRPIERYRRRPL